MRGPETKRVSLGGRKRSLLPEIPLRTRIALAAGGTLAAAATLLGLVLYEPRTFIPGDLAWEYMKSYPTPRQLRPGWVLRSVQRYFERPTKLVHGVEVAPEIAGDLMMMGSRQRRRLIGEVACPDASHPIWAQLSRGQDVVIELATDKGPFQRVSCRAAVF